MNSKKPQQVRIVIADDHPIFRDGLRRLLEAEPDLKVLGEASDGAEAVKQAKSIDRMAVIKTLETGVSVEAPSGKVTIDPPTHHCVLDVHIAEVKDKKLNVLEHFPQQKPSDTAAVCDLIKNPDDNQQYVIKI